MESRYEKILEAGLIYPQQVITQLSSVKDILSDVLNSNYDYIFEYFDALNDKLYGWNTFLEYYYNIGNERVENIRTGGINDDSLKVIKEFNNDNFDNFLCLDNNRILTVRSMDVNDVRKLISVEIETVDSYLKVIKFFDRNVSVYFGSLLKNYFMKIVVRWKRIIIF